MSVRVRYLVLDMVGHKTIAIIPISAESQRIAISNDDKMVFTSDQTKPQMAVIDTATNKIKTWVPLPAVGYGTSPTPDGRFLLIALPKANDLAVLDLASLKVVRTVDVADDPVKVLAEPRRRRARMSPVPRRNRFAVVDTVAVEGSTLIDAGKGVDGLAWAGPAPLLGPHSHRRPAIGKQTGE